MSTHKDQKMKKHIIATRKRITPGLTNAPVFAMQKKRARIYNKKAKRHWRAIDMGALHRKKTKESNRPKGFKKTKRNTGKAKPNVHRMHKKKK